MAPRTALITGCSSGIGKAIALHLADGGWDVLAGVRNMADAPMVRQGAPGTITPLRLDVADEASRRTSLPSIRGWLGERPLQALVNNAGIAIMGPLPVQPMATFRAHFEVNLFGALAVTQDVLPMMGPAGAARIVNISSVGGEVASPFLGAYTASKHALEAISDCLRRELISQGIDVIVVGPGAIRTPIWDKAEASPDFAAYADTPWKTSLERYATAMLGAGRSGLTPEQVARVVATALTSARPRARYAPVPNRLINYDLPRLLPRRWLDQIFRRSFGL